ncbi:MAG: alanine--tRNA ligase [Ruminococcaceae bacterium]|nr:alanine--tRNA ligase [Oscillospiraceae bacterium]
MKWTGLNELREQYLSFFEGKEHLRHKSFPLVPINDKSLLLINAGMAPLKKYFTGEEEPPRRRMTTCQKCIRTPDIERIGYTARHGTFFEMLGNFSFGNYFKTEAIHWAWEFCTTVLELPVDRLWVTIYENDDEAFEIWNKEIGVDASHIVRLGKDDNFWEIGSGPCGPCSEIYFDRGIEFGCGSDDCKPGCDCDRFMEFWNLVFTQFDGDGEGNYTPLANPNIDTGMGLERLACLMQGVNNLFEVDTIQNIMAAISEKAGVKYGENKEADISLRIITDHIRSTTFLVCDGVVPTNEGRGYVLRRLLRRAARHGRLLGIKGTFLTDIVAVVAKENITAYPELTEKLDYIQKIIGIEENKFAQTIDSGLEMLNEMVAETKAAGSTVLAGEGVFKLNDTFGFPIDLTRELASENGLTIDEEGFKACLDEQKARSRAATAALGDFGWVGETFEFLEGLNKTEFTGYTEEETEAKVVKIVNAETKEELDAASEGKVIVILDKTPFYGEGGGQVGDTGKLHSDTLNIKVTNTKKHDDVFMHICDIEEGMISVGDTLTAKVCSCRRNAIKRNHSAVHLLQAALRQVLGNHVEQAGSYVDNERLRFDFRHFAAMTADELAQTEKLVNKVILEGLNVETVETDVDSAKAMGAMALFGEKYGSLVRVVKMGDFSTELCGGTHLDNTAKAGLFKIISETSVAAGVRRIEATTGMGVLALMAEKDELILNTAKELKSANVADITKRASALQAELKAAKSEIEALNGKMAASKASELTKDARDIKGLSVCAVETKDIAVDVARTMCDNVKADNSKAVIVIACNCGGKLNFVAACGKDAVALGAHAGNIVREISVIAGGKGGGRPDSAVSGAKDASKIADALEAVYTTVEGMIN